MKASSHTGKICTGCLSQGRRMTRLTGAAAEYFDEIVLAAGGTLGGAVCWECTAKVQNALEFRANVTDAVHTLTSYQLNKGIQFNSLSQLSCHNLHNVVYATYRDMAFGGPEQSPLFVQTGDDLDSHVGDVVLEYYVEPVEAVLEPDITKTRQKKKTKKTQTSETEEFDVSDDEPLATKSGACEQGDGSKAKKQGKAVEAKRRTKEKGKRGKGRKEGASGVVRNARVVNKLARLGLAPGALDMVVLSWDEVEAERQRALSSEKYLRLEHRCELCVMGFNHHLKLEKHMKKHDTSAGEYECSVCRVRSRAPHALAAHRRRHRVRWRCSVCGAIWSRAAVAADHLRRHGPLPAGAGAAPTHTCRVCSHTAPTLNKLRVHMRGHAAPQTCPRCGKRFRDGDALRTHLFSHVADKEHTCAECGARFLYPRALRLHALTHEPPAPTYCHECDVTFKNPMSYYQHMKYSLKHCDPDKLKHACELCPARFVRAARLADHVAARHTHRTPHRCEVPGCSYRCASRPVLRAHIRTVHAAPGARLARRLVCHLCGHTYSTKMSLERHLRTHTNNSLPSRTERRKRTRSSMTEA